MKNASLILGAFAAVFAAASIYLGMQLGGAHQQLAQAEQGRLNDQARIRELEQERVDLEAALAESSGPVLSAAPTDPSSPALTDKQILNPPPPPPGVVGGSRPAERAPRGAESQAVQNNRRLQQEIRLRRRYAEMPEALGLDPKQADQLYDLLADQQFVESNDARAYEGDRLGRQAIESAARQQRDAAIEALLGPDKAAEFQSFEKSIPARMQVSRIGESMAAANVPLSDTQRKSLIAAVVKEQEAGPPPVRPADVARNDPDYEARYLAWQADYSRRVTARVEPLLTMEQARTYRDAVRAQDTRRAEARARAEARRNPGSPP